MGGRGASGWIRIGWAFACALLSAACADSRQASSDGQTHWLRGCDSDGDCSELSCVCGVCSSACSDDRGCDALPGSGAVCSTAEALPSAGACTRAAASVSLCLPSCEREGDCTAIGEHLSCERGLCVPAAEAEPQADAQADANAAIDGAAHADAAADGSAGTDAAGADARVVDAAADGGVQLPLEIDCQTLAAGGANEAAELVVSLEGAVENLALSDGVVYGTRGELWRWQAPAAEVEPVAGVSGAVQVLAIDGDELFVGAVAAAPPNGIAKLPLEGGAVLNLASEPIDNISSVAVAGDLVYWAGDDAGGSAGSGTVFRSDREPGETIVLASLPGQPVARTVHMIGESVYFVMNEVEAGVFTGTQIYRVAADGGAAAEPLGARQAMLTALVESGGELFAVRAQGRDELGNPLGNDAIARVNVDDGSLELLFELGATSPSMLVVDARDAYWATGAESGSAQLWRGRKDGSAGPSLLAMTQPPVTALADDPSSLYAALYCDGTTHIIRIPKPST